jgi:hypothetical protein
MTDRIVEIGSSIREITYKFSPTFIGWLLRYKPAILEYEPYRKLKEVPLTISFTDNGRPGRCRLTFPAPDLPAASTLFPAAETLRTRLSREFDRQIDSDDLCLVLDAHPDLLGHVPPNAKELRLKDKYGTECRFGNRHLRVGDRIFYPVWPAIAFSSVQPSDVVVWTVLTVKKVEYFVATLVDEAGAETIADVDGLRCLDRGFAWIQEVGS